MSLAEPPSTRGRRPARPLWSGLVLAAAAGAGVLVLLILFVELLLILLS